MRTRNRLTPLDYGVMIGGPVIFLTMVVLAIRFLIGTSSPMDPVKQLRDGMIHPGASQAEVLKTVGEPKAIVSNPNGTESYRYQHESWDSERKTFVEEDAYIDFDSSSHVSGISFESRTPNQPK